MIIISNKENKIRFRWRNKWDRRKEFVWFLIDSTMIHIGLGVISWFRWYFKLPSEPPFVRRRIGFTIRRTKHLDLD